jgi:hypothetical protein
MRAIAKHHKHLIMQYFTSERADRDNQYAVMADEMVKLTSVQPGFLGVYN